MSSQQTVANLTPFHRYTCQYCVVQVDIWSSNLDIKGHSVCYMNELQVIPRNESDLAFSARTDSLKGPGTFITAGLSGRSTLHSHKLVTLSVYSVLAAYISIHKQTKGKQVLDLLDWLLSMQLWQCLLHMYRYISSIDKRSEILVAIIMLNGVISQVCGHLSSRMLLPLINPP